MQALGIELDKSYIDIAGRVNERVVGLYGLNTQVVTGESWFLSGQAMRQQTLRQVYQYTAVGSFPHGINLNSVTLFSKPFGSYTDGTNWYGVIYGSSVAIAGQLSFYVTPMSIVILAGAGAPAPTNITIVLEWLSIF